VEEVVTGEATLAVVSPQAEATVNARTLVSTAVEMVTDLLSAPSPESQETLPASSAVRRVTCPESAPTSSQVETPMEEVTTPVPVTTVDSQAISPETALPSQAEAHTEEAVTEAATTVVNPVTSAETAPSPELREALVDMADPPVDTRVARTDRATTVEALATSAETAPSPDLVVVVEATAPAEAVVHVTIAARPVTSPETAQLAVPEAETLVTKRLICI